MSTCYAVTIFKFQTNLDLQVKQALQVKLSRHQHLATQPQLPHRRGNRLLPLQPIQRRLRDTKSVTTNEKLFVGVRSASFAVQIPSIVLVYYERFKTCTVAVSSYFLLFLYPTLHTFASLQTRSKTQSY